MNFVDRRSKYKIIKERKLYDPPELYTLESGISYPPRLK
jgi:hypothetical protein